MHDIGARRLTKTMTPRAPDAAPAPIGAGERIAALDFLRGIAVMGILAANIVGLGQPLLASTWPGAFMTDPGDPGGWLWIAQFVAIDGKMRGLFTLLFGAGLYLFMERAWARGAGRGLQAWRLTVLMVFGLVHFFLIWPGDILFSYALFGLVALAALRWDAKAQIGAGLAGYLVGTVYYAATFTMPYLIAETALGDAEQMHAAREALLAAIETAGARGAASDAAIVAGDYAGLVALRVETQLWSPLSNALVFGFETLPLMLIGMGLYRIGFFSGALGRGRMLRWGWIGLVAGAAAHFAIALFVKAADFGYYATLGAFLAWSPLPRLWMVLGLAALLVVWAPSATGWLGDRVRAAGRAAFTNYLGTSVVMMVVFHGWGLGLYGELNRPQLYLVMLAGCALMLAWSKPWLDRYRYGPLEWLWRCLTYRTVFPLRR
jgi:uncharacterized protein